MNSASSVDRYKLCLACPLRHQADLFDALGEAKKAQDIREAGCGWWQEGIPSVDAERGFMAQPTYTGCFKPYLPSYLITVWHCAGHAVAAYNDARNKVLRAIEEKANDELPPVVGQLLSLALPVLAGASEYSVGRGGQEQVSLPPGDGGLQREDGV